MAIRQEQFGYFGWRSPSRPGLERSGRILVGACGGAVFAADGVGWARYPWPKDSLLMGRRSLPGRATDRDDDPDRRVPV